MPVAGGTCGQSVPAAVDSLDVPKATHVIRAHKDERPVDLPQEGLDFLIFGVLPDHPRQYWHQCSDPEEMEQRRVHLSNGVQATWTNQTPDH